MTNNDLVEELIQVAIEVGRNLQSSGCEMVPGWTNSLALRRQAVLERMIPETEVVTEVKGENIALEKVPPAELEGGLLEAPQELRNSAPSNAHRNISNCSKCGQLMVRKGTNYKCINCGSSTPIC